jgi:hypothetical protein
LPTVSEKVNFSAIAPDDELLLDDELLDEEELLLDDDELELELLDDELELDDELLELELLLDELDDVVPPQAAKAPINVDNTTTRENDDAEKGLNSTIMCTR